MSTRADPDKVQRTEASRFFVGVGRQRMRKAIALARRGQVHPDPDVAVAAVRWANMVLAYGPAHPELDSSRLRRYRALLGEMTWVSGSYAEWLRDRSLRRSARLIIEAAEPGEHNDALQGPVLPTLAERAACSPVSSPATGVRDKECPCVSRRLRRCRLQRRKMERIVKIGRYDDHGFHLEWASGFEICVADRQGEIIILANKAGLVSLAQHLLTLAEDAVPVGSHIHMDASRELEDGSLDLILERTA